MLKLPKAIARILRKEPTLRPSMFVDLQSEEGIRLLKTRLQDLQPSEQFEGVKQVNGNNYPYLKGWIFRRRVGSALPGQIVLIFFNGFIERAVVWLESGAPALRVPSAPAATQPDPAIENAIDLEGEQYFEPDFKGDGKIYTCRYMDPAW